MSCTAFLVYSICTSAIWGRRVVSKCRAQPSQAEHQNLATGPKYILLPHDKRVHTYIQTVSYKALFQNDQSAKNKKESIKIPNTESLRWI